MSRLLLAVLAMLLAACSAASERGEPNDDTIGPLPLDYFEDQQRCISSWRGLVIEWRDMGGRVLPTNEQTRRALELELDTRSQVAGLFQDFWRRRDQQPQTNAGQVFMNTAEEYVPPDCASFTGLGDALASVDGAMSEEVMSQLRVQSAEDFEGNDPGLGIWVVMELIESKGE